MPRHTLLALLMVCAAGWQAQAATPAPAPATAPIWSAEQVAVLERWRSKFAGAEAGSTTVPVAIRRLGYEGQAEVLDVDIRAIQGTDYSAIATVYLRFHPALDSPSSQAPGVMADWNQHHNVLYHYAGEGWVDYARLRERLSSGDAAPSAATSWDWRGMAVPLACLLILLVFSLRLARDRRQVMQRLREARAAEQQLLGNYRVLMQRHDEAMETQAQALAALREQTEVLRQISAKLSSRD